MPRKDRTYKTLDIIRITSKNMDTQELRLLFIWFQVAIPAIILTDLFEETFVEKFAPRNIYLRWYSLYRRARRVINFDPLDFIIRAFLPKDYLTLLECIDSIKGKFGVERD